MGKLQINGDVSLVDQSSRVPTLSWIRQALNDTYTDWRIRAESGNFYIQHQINNNDWTTSFYFNEASQGGTIGTQYSISAAGGFVGNLSGNAATATKLATARTISLTGSVTGSGSFDGSGNLSIATTTNHTHSYLPLSGGTMTGAITLAGNRYYATSGNYGLNCQNSDIVEANGIYFGDLVDGGGEGINFSRDSSTWDTLYAKSGGLYFHPNRALEATPNGYTILHSNNYTSYTVTKTGSGASGTWGINVTGSAGSVAWRNVTGKPSTFTPSAHSHTYLASGGTPTSDSSHADALQKYFNRNKASIPRDCLLTYYSTAYSNGSQYMGYFLSNYDSTPYGGFFVAHYNNPYYVGISYGSYIQQHILTSTNYESYAVSVAGGTMTGTLEIKGSGSDRATLEVFSSSNIPCDLWLGSNNLTKWSITCRASDENYMLGLYNKDNNYSLHIKPSGEIIFDKPGHQYGSSFPSSPTKGQIFFKT